MYLGKKNTRELISITKWRENKYYKDRSFRQFIFLQEITDEKVEYLTLTS